MNVLCRDCGERAFAKEDASCPRCHSVRIVRHAELHSLSLAHIDCDAFYAAIEKRDHEELREVPLIVGARHRGVVAACCYLARAHGVHSAMPMFKALKACPDAKVVRPDMKKYKAVSEELRTMMLALTPLVEPLSIDEAYLDLSGTADLHGASPARILARLAKQVEATLGITVTIGLSYNKFLAKIASDLDKPRGFSVIGRAEAREFLADKPVGLLWGVGRALQRRLAHDGIRTIGELVRLKEHALVARYGKIGSSLYSFARGRDDRTVNPERETKSLSTEITLDHDISDPEALRTTLWKLCETLSARMKKAGLMGQGVTLKLKTRDFRCSRVQGNWRLHPFRTDLFNTGGYCSTRKPTGGHFAWIGIGAHSLVEADTLHQGDLFEEDTDEGIGEPPVEGVLDEIQEKFGPKSVVRGRGFGIDLQPRGPGKTE